MNTRRNSVVLSLSGGLDSTSLLLKYLSEGIAVHTLSFSYGQRHVKEIVCAQNVVKMLKGIGTLSHEIIDLSGLSKVFGESALTSNVPVPEGHYADESMKVTVVPFRNGVFLSLLTAYAQSLNIGRIAYAAHLGNHDIYPDCRLSFVIAMRKAIWLGGYMDNVPCLEAPFLRLSKIDVLRVGIEYCNTLGLDWKHVFASTWTCYKGEESACGKCGACIERLEAFEKLGHKDTIKYEHC